jgi:hypothetical protein
LEETLDWQAQSGVHEDIAKANEEAEAGALMSEAEVSRRYGVGHV